MARKTCGNCGIEVDEYVKFCPQCGHSSFKSINLDSNISNFNVNSLNSVNPVIGKLFYWNENDEYYFSKTKFFSILIFLDIFIGRIYYTSDIIVSFLVALIVTIIAFLVGRSIHKKNNVCTDSFGLVRDIINLLFYWNGSVISKTKVLVILIYCLLIIVYCNNVGWNMFFAGTLIFLIWVIPAYYIGRYIHDN